LQQLRQQSGSRNGREREEKTQRAKAKVGDGSVREGTR